MLTSHLLNQKHELMASLLLKFSSAVDGKGCCTCGDPIPSEPNICGRNHRKDTQITSPYSRGSQENDPSTTACWESQIDRSDSFVTCRQRESLDAP